MGLENRDYLRDEAKRYGEGGGFQFGFGGSGSNEWAIRTLLILNIAVFFLQNLSRESPVTLWLSLNLDDVAHLQVWRLLTYGFCHGGLFHILFNMYILWMFGKMVEGIYGSKEFFSFYLTAVIGSGICFLIFEIVSGGNAIVLGASGGVFAVSLLTAMHFPTRIILVMFVIPMQLLHMVILFIALDILFLMKNDGVAHAAHLGGAAFGYLYYRKGWRISPLFSGLSSPVKHFKAKQRARQREQELQIFEPNDDELQDELDRILAKIKQQGESSLTPEERESLERASRYFRGR